MGPVTTALDGRRAPPGTPIEKEMPARGGVQGQAKKGGTAGRGPRPFTVGPSLF